jgi:hypothetical protein
MDIDAHQIAARLGVTELRVHRLRRRGYLHTLDVTEGQIRQRLYAAARAYALRSGGEADADEGVRGANAVQSGELSRSADGTEC